MDRPANAVDCRKCGGTGKARGVIVGTVSSQGVVGDDTCPKCMGSGYLVPVEVNARPAEFGMENPSSG